MSAEDSTPRACLPVQASRAAAWYPRRWVYLQTKNRAPCYDVPGGATQSKFNMAWQIWARPLAILS